MNDRSTHHRLMKLRWEARLKRDADGAPLLSPLFVLHQGPGVHVVDLRPVEQATGALGYIPGSVFVGVDGLERDARELPDGLPVVLVSRTGDDAAEVALRLERSGMKHVAAMTCGLAAWRRLGFGTSRDPAGVTETLKPVIQAVPSEGPLSAAQVRDHVGDPRNIRWLKFAALTKYAGVSCIDGRDERGLIGTPGGDAGEFLLSLAALERVTGVKLGEDAVAHALLARIDTFGDFSMHTDGGAFKDLVAALVSDPRFEGASERSESEWIEFLERPPVAVHDALLEHLENPDHLGCGHVRLMLQKPDEYGIRSELVTFFLRSFHRLWWEGAPELAITLLPGGHEEAAVINVRLEEELWSMSRIPLVAPTFAGRQVFVNHPDVATHLRRGVAGFHRRGLGPVVVDDGAALDAIFDELATQQLTQTVGYLAKGLPIYDVVFSRDGSFDVRES